MSLEALKESIKFTKGERKSLWVLLSCIVIILTINIWLRNVESEPRLTEKQIEHLYDLIVEKELKAKSHSRPTSITITPQNFDPNRVSQEELIALGWPEYPARNLVNYRNKGGSYRKKSDVRKIYGMTDELYAAIEDYINLPKREYPNTKATPSPPKKVASSKKSKPKSILNLSPIAPNSITQDELINMGIPKYVAKNWISFRKKGKIYRSREDIKKIYGLDAELFTSIEPYLKFESVTDTSTVAKKAFVDRPAPTKKETRKVNLNTATMAQLQEVKGIGAAYSKALIEYRKKLGGYYSINQLYEITWIPAERIDAFADQLMVDNSYKRIEVKKVRRWFDLMTHPYIGSKKDARIIHSYFKLRSQKDELNRFMRTAKINSDTLQLLRPYLELNE